MENNCEVTSSLCELWQETEALECRGCDKNKHPWNHYKRGPGGDYADKDSGWHRENQSFYATVPDSRKPDSNRRGKYIRKEKAVKPCQHPNCTDDAYCKGLCANHYQQQARKRRKAKRIIKVKNGKVVA